MVFLFYDLASGEIGDQVSPLLQLVLRLGLTADASPAEAQAALAALAAEGRGVVAHSQETTTGYVREGVVVERPRLAVADLALVGDGAPMVVAEGVPEGTQVWRDRKLIGICADGFLEFTPVEPGRTVFQLKPPFPFLDATLRIDVT